MPDTAANPVAPGNTAFGLDLYDQLNDDADNVFYSPFSVSAALAMTAAGARGETLSEMQKVLHLPPEQAVADRGFSELFDALNAGDPKARGFTLSVANAIYAQKGYPWREEFKTRVAGQYGAGLNEADFVSGPGGFPQDDQRLGRKRNPRPDQELAGPGDDHPAHPNGAGQRDLLQGRLGDRVQEGSHQRPPFTTAGGTKTDVPLMHRVGRFGHATLDGFQVAELPYKGGEATMVVLLPDRPDGLAALEKKLTPDSLRGWLGQLRSTPDVRLYLPRFKLETEYGLNDPLKALGMKRAFDHADFSGMSAGGEELAISAVVHKAFVEVNEEGTEAAAATGVILGIKSAVRPRPPVVFRADHPFLFLIRHKPTDSVLFLGRYEKP